MQQTAKDVFGSLKVTLLDGTEYDFGGEWKTISMYESLSEALGEEIIPNGGPDAPGTSVEHLGAIADKLGVERDDVENHGKLVEHLWEHFYEDKLYEPVFVRDFPVETSPLVKSHRTKPGVVEKWDLYVRGFELATGYSELNDPVVQRERFVAQPRTHSPATPRRWTSTRTSLRPQAWACPGRWHGHGHRPFAHRPDRRHDPRDHHLPAGQAAQPAVGTTGIAAASP